jgi:SulP family sulfate permease
MIFLPILSWLKTYQRVDFYSDLFAGLITAILLVPQGIAYAIIAGLPPQFGLYPSILPPIFYALLGTSRTMSVGPVAVAAIMIFAALHSPEVEALGNPLQSAMILSALSGLIMLGMAILRMGGLVHFISHPVLTGFTSGASLLIIFSQLPKALGMKLPNCYQTIDCYVQSVQTVNLATLSISLFSLFLLLFFAHPLKSILHKLGMSTSIVTAITKCAGLFAVVTTTCIVSVWQLNDQGVAVVGFVPTGFPQLSVDFLDWHKWQTLLPSASFIALIAYVESIAIAKVVGNLRGEKINPNQELVALGVVNVMTAVSGGMPAAGGLSRTMVNFAAGARTQIAAIVSASILAIAVMFCSDWFYFIPKATLAVIILLAILPLVKLKSIYRTWHYDKSDGIAEFATFLGVIILGIEEGITLGILLTFIAHLRKTSHPHIAVVGRIPNTQQFKNIKRHQVETWPHLLLIRIDENFTFTNINFIEEFIEEELKKTQSIQHLILIFSSVSDIDMTALEALEQLSQKLKNRKITLNISQAKGFVLDKLQKSDFFKHLNGMLFLDTQEAITKLTVL